MDLSLGNALEISMPIFRHDTYITLDNNAEKKLVTHN